MREYPKRIDPSFPLADLRDHPDNPKLHDDDEMDESLEETGFSGVIVAQEGANFILDGHGRRSGLLRKGLTHEAVQFIDIPDDLARKIVLNRNKVGKNAGFDPEALLALLDDFAEQGDLIGTGYTADERDDLLAGFGSIDLEEQEFQGSYAESEDEAKARAERKTVTKVSLGLREVVLVYPDEEYERVMQAIAYVGEFHSADSTSAAVAAAVVNYATQLAADVESADVG